MLWPRILLFLIPVSIALAAPSPSSRETPQKTAQQKRVKIAATIQNYETQLSAVEYELNQACAEESAILGELDSYNQRLMETIHYLRHATQYSPLLAMLSAPKPEDVIHSSLLLRSITPEMHARNQQLLEKIKTLSHIRTQLEAKQNQLRDITFHYHQEREKLDTLLRNPSQTSAAIEENSENNLAAFTLIPPVAGKLIRTYKNSNPAWTSFTQGVLFSARNGAQVISPLSGIIAFAGEYVKGQGKVVIIETSNSRVVMSGLGSLNYVVGRHITAGEPVGCMPTKYSKKTKAPDQNNPKLYLEVWCQDQAIDPQTVLEEKRKK